MDLIKIEIECKITTKYAFFRFRVLGGAEIFVCHICRRGTLMFDGRYRLALHWGVWMMATLNSTSTSPEVGFHRRRDSGRRSVAGYAQCLHDRQDYASSAE